MDATQHAEQVAIQAALARGYLDPERLRQAQHLAAQPGSPGLLRILGQRFLSPEQASALGQLYQQALSASQGHGATLALASPPSTGTQFVQLPGGTAPGPLPGRPPLDPTLISGPPGPPPGGYPAQGRPAGIGDTLGPYRLLKELARGGMGVVYVAEREGLDRKVALKQLLAGGGDDADERFLIEARIAARLRHPNIVGIHDVGQVGLSPYFAMDFIEGQDLADLIEAEGTLEPRRAALLTQKLAGALAYAHERAVLHRDIKPANVLVTPEDEPVLTDFGLAKDVGGGRDSGLTQAGAIMGTPSYMPPEQANGQTDLIDRRADIYSLGGTLYAMLTGLPPFRGSTPLNTISKVVSEPVVPPRKLQSAVPRDLEVICLKCLAKDPEERYATAKALGADLARFLASEPIEASPPNLVDRLEKWVRRNRTLTIFGFVAAGLLVVAALGVFFGVRAGAAREARVEAEQALASLEQVRDASAEVRLSHSLRAVQAAGRYRAAVGQESDEIYRQALLALGTAACDGQQLTLAEQAFQEAYELAPQDPEVAKRRAELSRIQNLRREAVREILAAVRAGDVLRFAQEADPVFELVRYPEERAQLVAALDEVSERLLSLQLEFLRAAAPAAAVESEALEEDLQDFQSLCRTGERPTDAMIEGRFAQIARVRKRMTATAGFSSRISYAQLLRNHLAPTSEGDRRVARVACEALGRIGRDAQDAIPALQRYLAVEPKKQSAIRACAALARIGTPAALEAVRPHRGRLHDTSIDFLFGRAAQRLGIQDAAPQFGTPTERMVDEVRSAIGVGEFSKAIAFCTEALASHPDDALARAWRAHALALRGDLDAAKEDIKTLFERPQDDAEVLAMAALAQSEVGQIDSALGNLKKAIERSGDPDRIVELRIPYAYLLVETNQVDLAREQVAEALRAAPSAKIYALQATICIGLGELNEAAVALEKAHGLDSEEPDVTLGYARLAMKKGLYQRAAPLYDRVIERRRSDPQVLSERALAKAALGQGAEALQDFERALKLTLSSKQRGDLLFNRAKCLMDLGRAEEAFADAKEVIQLRPDFDTGWVMLATLLLGGGNAKQALEAVQHAIDINASAKALGLRGRLRMVLGKVPQAIADLGRALELEPHNSQYRADRSNAYLQLGRFAEALEDLSLVLEREPDHVIALRTRAQLYGSTGRIEEAQVDVRRLTTVAPNDAETGFVKAAVAYYSKDYQRALDLIEATQTLDHAKDDPQSLQIQGQCLRALGRHKEAIKSLGRIVELKPTDAMARLQLGGACIDAGESEQARIHLEKFLELTPPQAPQRAQVEAFLKGLAEQGK